ncbi:single-stranded DNA-binding protein [Wenjunlia vitaminophila]|uniref:Single-stranded DNA-binding protein n=1 Tax=Wenjunlia vitaminophila TaxID=76728 RepID=A0A0T6LN53_WENVI|nr:single-stranded DNA-binding protein [Wenjunlia vitaminophila]KRV47297.1 single-stranded DNA-binding protein [Wenjunlia vitaminophila]
MAGETVITIVGNLTDDPALRFTQSGAAVASFTIASTPRTFDRQSNEWKDGEALFMRCSLWRQAAENAAESLQRGMRVVAQGRLRQRSYEVNGEKRTVVEMEVDEIGPSLRYATAKVTKTGGRGGQGGYGGGPSGGGWGDAPAGGPQGGPSGGAPSDDPWATGAPASGGQGGGWGGAPSGGGGGGYSDEPPF